MDKETLLNMSAKEIEGYNLSKTNSCINCDSCVYCDYCTGCTNCKNCTNCTNCTNCGNCYTCINCTTCTSCTSCYRCTKLKDKKFSILNVQLTKEEYETKIKEIKGQLK